MQKAHENEWLIVCVDNEKNAIARQSSQCPEILGWDCGREALAILSWRQLENSGMECRGINIRNGLRNSMVKGA